jgi:hypothetical protein
VTRFGQDFQPIPAGSDKHRSDPERLPPVEPTILRQAFNELVVTHPTNDPEPEKNSENSKCEPEDVARDLQQVSSYESWLSLFSATDASPHTLAFFQSTASTSTTNPGGKPVSLAPRHHFPPPAVLNKPHRCAPHDNSKVPFGKIPRCVLSQMWKDAHAFSASICSSLS